VCCPSSCNLALAPHPTSLHPTGTMARTIRQEYYRTRATLPSLAVVEHVAPSCSWSPLAMEAAAASIVASKQKHAKIWASGRRPTLCARLPHAADHPFFRGDKLTLSGRDSEKGERRTLVLMNIVASHFPEIFTVNQVMIVDSFRSPTQHFNRSYSHRFCSRSSHFFFLGNVSRRVEANAIGSSKASVPGEDRSRISLPYNDTSSR